MASLNTSNNTPSAFINTPPATPAQIKPSNVTIPAKSNNVQSSSISNKPIACLRCKSKKVKCDGRTPACTACVKAKEKCLISDMVTQRVYPRGYIEELETKVAELQSLIDTKSREARQNEGQQMAMMYADSPIPSVPSMVSDRRTSSASLPQNSSDGQISPLEDADGDVSLARLLVRSLGLKDHGPCVSKLALLVSNDSSPQYLLPPPSSNLPPREIASKLLQSYLSTDYRCFPFMFRHEIQETIDRVYTQPPQRISQEDYFRTFMIFAIASLSFNEQDATSSAFTFYASALHASRDLQLMTGISALQNLLFLCIFSLNARITLDAWRISRKCIHICIQDELHLEFTRPMDKQSLKHQANIEYQEELRKRVFWSSYCLNRITSNFLYDRPPSIPEAEIDASLPSDMDFDALIGTVPQPRLPEPLLLGPLTRLYRLSTTAFTSFQPSAAQGDVAQLLQKYLLELSEIHMDTFGTPANPRQFSVPIYVKYSFDAHNMLILKWALDAIWQSGDALPRHVRSHLLTHAVDALSSVINSCENYAQYTVSRLSFLVIIRTLFIILSCLLCPETISKEGIPEATHNSDVTQMVTPNFDETIKRSLEYLIFFGKSFGHGNTFIPALALALRYAIVEEIKRFSGPVDIYPNTNGLVGNPELMPQYVNPSGQTKPLSIHTIDNTLTSPLDPSPSARFFQVSPQAFDSYEPSLQDLQAHCPELYQYFQTLGIQKHPLRLYIDNPNIINTFKKFGSSSHDLEILSIQILRRLELQRVIGQGTKFNGYEDRRGINRQIHGGADIDSSEDVIYTTNGDAVNRPYQLDANAYNPMEPYKGFIMPPKMDVDFSGFETNVQFMEM